MTIRALATGVACVLLQASTAAAWNMDVHSAVIGSDGTVVMQASEKHAKRSRIWVTTPGHGAYPVADLGQVALENGPNDTLWACGPRGLFRSEGVPAGLRWERVGPHGCDGLKWNGQRGVYIVSGGSVRLSEDAGVSFVELKKGPADFVAAYALSGKRPTVLAATASGDIYRTDKTGRRWRKVHTAERGPAASPCGPQLSRVVTEGMGFVEQGKSVYLGPIQHVCRNRRKNEYHGGLELYVGKRAGKKWKQELVDQESNQCTDCGYADGYLAAHMTKRPSERGYYDVECLMIGHGSDMLLVESSSRKVLRRTKIASDPSGAMSYAESLVGKATRDVGPFVAKAFRYREDPITLKHRPSPKQTPNARFTSDGRRIWREAGDNTVDISNGVRGFVTAIAGDGTRLYAAAGDRMYHSNDGGLSWARLPQSAASTRVRSFVVALELSGEVLVAGSASGIQIRSSGTDSLAVLKDGTQLTSPVWALTSIGDGSRRRVIAATWDGIYADDGTGSTWSRVWPSQGSAEAVGFFRYAPSVLSALTADGIVDLTVDSTGVRVAAHHTAGLESGRRTRPVAIRRCEHSMQRTEFSSWAKKSTDGRYGGWSYGGYSATLAKPRDTWEDPLYQDSIRCSESQSESVGFAFEFVPRERRFRWRGNPAMRPGTIPLAEEYENSLLVLNGKVEIATKDAGVTWQASRRTVFPVARVSYQDDLILLNGRAGEHTYTAFYPDYFQIKWPSGYEECAATTSAIKDVLPSASGPGRHGKLIPKPKRFFCLKQNDRYKHAEVFLWTGGTMKKMGTVHGSGVVATEQAVYAGGYVSTDGGWTWTITVPVDENQVPFEPKPRVLGAYNGHVLVEYMGDRQRYYSGGLTVYARTRYLGKIPIGGKKVSGLAKLPLGGQIYAWFPSSNKALYAITSNYPASGRVADATTALIACDGKQMLCGYLRENLPFDGSNVGGFLQSTTNPRTLYVGSAAGLIVSVDLGKSWRRAEAYAATPPKAPRAPSAHCDDVACLTNPGLPCCTGTKGQQ